MIDFWKIKQKKDEFHKKVNEKLRDRVRYQMRDTLKIIGRLKNRGLTDKKISEEISKSSEVKKYETD